CLHGDLLFLGSCSSTISASAHAPAFRCHSVSYSSAPQTSPPSLAAGTEKEAPQGPLSSMIVSREERRLLEGDGGAGLLQLRLDLLGLVLGNALLDGLRRTLDGLLGLLQAQTRDLADHLDDSDLVVAEALEHHVELGLLLGGGSTVASSRSG